MKIEMFLKFIIFTPIVFTLLYSAYTKFFRKKVYCGECKHCFNDGSGGYTCWRCDAVHLKVDHNYYEKKPGDYGFCTTINRDNDFKHFEKKVF